MFMREKEENDGEKKVKEQKSQTRVSSPKAKSHASLRNSNRLKRKEE